MQQKKKQARPNSDRSGDRFLHDIVSASLAGAENMKRDVCIDQGAKTYGSSHRSQFPHRNIGEACAYMCFQDVVNQRKVDVATNFKLTCGHFLVDRLPSKLKEKMKLVQQIQGIFG